MVLLHYLCAPSHQKHGSGENPAILSPCVNSLPSLPLAWGSAPLHCTRARLQGFWSGMKIRVMQCVQPRNETVRDGLLGGAPVCRAERPPHRASARYPQLWRSSSRAS